MFEFSINIDTSPLVLPASQLINRNVESPSRLQISMPDTITFLKYIFQNAFLRIRKISKTNPEKPITSYLFSI